MFLHVRLPRHGHRNLRYSNGNFPRTAVHNAAVDVISLSGNNTTTPIGLTGINSGNSSSPNWVLSAGTLTLGSSMLLFGDLTDGTATPPTWSATSPAGLFTLLDSFLLGGGGGECANSPFGELLWWSVCLVCNRFTWHRQRLGGEPLRLRFCSRRATPCTSPSVTTNPSNVTKTYGDASATFTAAASGTPAPTVQWQVSTNGGGSFSNLSNGGNISGATTDTLTISNPTVAMSGNQYHAVFTNTCNGTQTATSTAATLTVNKANATVVVTPYSCPATTYDGLPHSAAVTSITGVNGETGATVGTVDVSNTTHTNAGHVCQRLLDLHWHSQLQ